MVQKYLEISVVIFVLATTLISGSSACPSGCICRGSPEKRDTAVCYRPWADRAEAVKFDEPITSIEFRHLLFQDIEPYLSAVRHASTVVIYPPKTSAIDNPLPEDLFDGMDKLEALTIHPTIDRLAPEGLADAIMPLTNLETLDFVGNTMQCDCELPDTLASQDILVLSKARMSAVKGCKEHGFPNDFYNINDFLEKCAELGGYEISEPSNEVLPVGSSGLSNRFFGNVRDQNLFNTGIRKSPLNANPVKPFGAISSAGAFRGALGKPPSGDLRRPDPGEKRVLLRGAIPGRVRRPPSFSASQLAQLHTRNSRPRNGRWGRRRLLSFDEGDSDPALSEAIDLPRGEKMRERRQTGTQGVAQGVSPKRRRPVKANPGMTMDEFINAHKRQRRGMLRPKNKNEWTRLSEGWRMREIRSIDSGNNSDSTISTGVSTPPPPQLHEEGSQGVSLNPWDKNSRLKAWYQKVQGKRSVDELSRFNQTEHQLTEDTTNQGLIGNVQQPTLNVNRERNQGHPRNHPPGQEHDRRHHKAQVERARQLTVYQLPMNDITVKLNPFDPFEVDLFFQYILHKESSPGRYRLPHHDVPHP